MAHMLRAKDNASIITGQGTYKIINGNTYTEQVEMLSGRPDIKSTEIKLDYIFANDNKLLITSFKVGNSPIVYKEMWKRLDIVSQEKKQKETPPIVKSAPEVVKIK